MKYIQTNTNTYTQTPSENSNFSQKSDLLGQISFVLHL